MKLVQSFEEAVSVYNAFLSQRAFEEGYAAALAGVPRTQIPEGMNVFSGKWVEGWLSATFDTSAQTAGAPFRARMSNASGLPLLAA
jgi:ribosome modulation factor